MSVTGISGMDNTILKSVCDFLIEMMFFSCTLYLVYQSPASVRNQSAHKFNLRELKLTTPA